MDEQIKNSAQTEFNDTEREEIKSLILTKLHAKSILTDSDLSSILLFTLLDFCKKTDNYKPISYFRESFINDKTSALQDRILNSLLLIGSDFTDYINKFPYSNVMLNLMMAR